jgi:hypothetical protein
MRIVADTGILFEMAARGREFILQLLHPDLITNFGYAFTGAIQKLYSF